MKSSSRRALTSAALVLGVLGAGVGTAQASAGDPAAQAVVSCARQLEDSRVGVSCTFPGPTNRQFRAWASCSNGRVATGPWRYVNSGNWSWANCGRNVFVGRWGYDITV